MESMAWAATYVNINDKLANALGNRWNP